MSDYHGRYVWYELMTSDTEAAKSFYREVIGWNITKAEQSPMPYWMLNAGETPAAGMTDLPDEVKAAGIPPHWMGYIFTPDVAGTIAKAEQLGGKNLNGPIEIPNIGQFAVIADPQGAAFSIFNGSNAPTEPIQEPEIGHISWHELTTTDWSSAWSFYEALFGWKKTDETDMGPELGMYHMWGLGDIELGGMFNKPPGLDIPPNWTLYIRVEDIDAAVERVKALGGKVMNGPHEVPGGDRVAQCMDPQGAAFAMHHMTLA